MNFDEKHRDFFFLILQIKIFFLKLKGFPNKPYRFSFVVTEFGRIMSMTGGAHGDCVTVDVETMTLWRNNLWDRLYIPHNQICMTGNKEPIKNLTHVKFLPGMHKLRI